MYRVYPHSMFCNCAKGHICGKKQLRLSNCKIRWLAPEMWKTNHCNITDGSKTEGS